MHDTKGIEQFMHIIHKLHKIAGPKGVFDEQSIITPLQAHALLYLQRHPKSTVNALGKNLQLSSSAITQLTDRLEKSGFIKREAGLRDRRITILSLTQEGNRIFAKIHKEHIKKMKRFISFMPEKDIREFIRVFSNSLERIDGQKKSLKKK